MLGLGTAPGAISATAVERSRLRGQSNQDHYGRLFHHGRRRIGFTVRTLMTIVERSFLARKH